jgi:hypothetical protein
MTPMAEDVILDLVRSAWIVQAARAEVYEKWSRGDARFEAFAERARRAADALVPGIEAHGRRPDAALVPPHAAWMRSLAGEEGPDAPFADIFIARLGSWVAGHAGGLSGEAGALLQDVADQDGAEIVFPTDLPGPPPFERVDAPPVEPPGEVKFRFGILGDIHIGSKWGAKTARAAISDLNASGAELVVQLGDITDHGDRDEFERAAKILDALEMPFATMMGNHDVYSVAEDRLAGTEYYPNSFGRAADGVLLHHEGVNFAVLDSVEIGASPFSAFNLVSGTFEEGSGGAIVRGALTPPQHDILAEIAAPGAPPAFILMHHPPQPFTGFPPVIFGLRDADSGRIHATVDSGNVWGIFAGHTHRNNRSRTFDGVPAHEIAIPRDYPYCYALVDVTDDGYAFRFVQLSDEELLRELYPNAGVIHRRYGRGSEEALGFSWTKSRS